MAFAMPPRLESEAEHDTMTPIVRMIKNRHPQHAQRIIVLMLITSALTVLAGITLLLDRAF